MGRSQMNSLLSRQRIDRQILGIGAVQHEIDLAVADAPLEVRQKGKPRRRQAVWIGNARSHIKIDIPATAMIVNPRAEQPDLGIRPEIVRDFLLDYVDLACG